MHRCAAPCRALLVPCWACAVPCCAVLCCPCCASVSSWAGPARSCSPRRFPPRRAPMPWTSSPPTAGCSTGTPGSPHSTSPRTDTCRRGAARGSLPQARRWRLPCAPATLAAGGALSRGGRLRIYGPPAARLADQHPDPDPASRWYFGPAPPPAGQPPAAGAARPGRPGWTEAVHQARVRRGARPPNARLSRGRHRGGTPPCALSWHGRALRAASLACPAPAALLPARSLL